MRVLITGITGFAGSHLAEFLLAKGDVEVFGTYRWRSRMDNINHILGRVQLLECEHYQKSHTRRSLRFSPNMALHRHSCFMSEILNLIKTVLFYFPSSKLCGMIFRVFNWSWLEGWTDGIRN